MQFGIFGGASARRGLPAAESASGYEDFVEYHVEAEALGFHGSFVTEHHFTAIGQISSTLTLLTWVAARTTTLRLGTAVIVLPWHNPVLLAEQAATLDLLSRGRLDFGVGKGYRHNEFSGFAMPRRRRNGVSRKRSASSSRPGPAMSHFRITAGSGISSAS
jgi:alkanesulfonate monooxygenase SsuD/methylene tetrahydromethanopterin reductase-like flavin-dependent oxidoreductase (luciferase family)